MNKSCSESCDQNKGSSLALIKPLFTDCKGMLETGSGSGSGTGQHAIYFVKKWKP